MADLSWLKSSIAFADQHSGSMLVILTAVYVLGTLMMWVEMRRTRKKGEEPNVQISLEPQARWGNFFDLVVANIGNVAVFELRLSIEPAGLKTIGIRKLEDVNLFKRAVPVFGKGQTLRTFAISYVDFIHSDQPKQIMFTARYKTADGRSFEQGYDFDMEVYENMSASSEKTLNEVVEEMKKTTEQLEKIARHFERADLEKDLVGVMGDTKRPDQKQ